MYITDTLTDNFPKEQQIILISNFSMPVHSYLAGAPLACSELLQPYLPAGHQKKKKINIISLLLILIHKCKIRNWIHKPKPSRESHFLETLLRLFHFWPLRFLQQSIKSPERLLSTSMDNWANNSLWSFQMNKLLPLNNLKKKNDKIWKRMDYFSQETIN